MEFFCYARELFFADLEFALKSLVLFISQVTKARMLVYLLALAC